PKGRRDAAGHWEPLPGQSVKYEAPPGCPDGGGLLLPRVPDRCWKLICERQGLPFPDAATRAAGFWPWAMATPGLLLVICEGWKKALAAVSAGYAAVALPGVTMGRRVDADGSARLIPALQLLGGNGRPWLIAFDAERKPATAWKVAAAAGALAGSLRAAGGRPEIARLPLLPGADKTGLDDLLAAAGPEALDKALADTGPRPVLPPLRAADRIAPAGDYLGVVCPIPPPAVARLVALSAPMGAGKTEAIAAAVAPLLAVGVRVVLITHRQSLGAALADRLGLPWGEDANPESDLRQQGLALCIDSLCPESGLQIKPGDWRGCVVVIDEVVAVLGHALKGTGTAIAKRRPAVIETLSELLANASQVIAADAQLSDPVLKALEAATGERALLIGSDNQPAAGRELVVHSSQKSWRGELINRLKARQKLWIATTAAKPGSPNAAQNLALLALQHWPEARVLVVDADTVADENHDAAHLAGNPNGIAGRYDVVIASPAVAAGLSVDKLTGHFAAVMVIAGGTTDPDSIAQAAARVRDNCPRHLFAPERSPGDELRMGSGDGKPAALLHHLRQHETAIVAQLVAAGGDLEQGTTGPWLPLWGELAALHNRQRLAYRATVVALLKREGYAATDADPLDGDRLAAGEAATATLKAITTEAQAAADAAVIAAEPLTEAEAQELRRKRKRSPSEKARLARHRIAATWGLGATDPTPGILEADRQKLSHRKRFGWIIQTLEARPLVAAHDRIVAANSKGWAPDLCRETIGAKVAAADALNLGAWLARSNTEAWFTATDPDLIALQALAVAHRGGLCQALGITAGKRSKTTLQRLLALAGYELESKRIRGEDGQLWRYRVKRSALPDGVDPDQLEAAWRDQLATPQGIDP
ncbi:MAG: plasmid replication protein, CyRepA1 family, partial [Cyanobacteriota bacterium]